MNLKVHCSFLLGSLLLFASLTVFRAQKDLQSSIVHLRAAALEGRSHDEYRDLAAIARQRAQAYEQAIAAKHLYRGMIVSRHSADGSPSSVCDSLLFSSLYFVALHKLGSDAAAARAWESIVDKGYQNGRWIRHPDCKRKSSSRDMIVGLMAALSQEPKGHEQQFARLLGVIARTGGSVDDGPFYVSRLSPGMGELLKHMAASRGWPEGQVPAPVRVGFSTVEFDTWIAAPGFGAHLNALSLWIELELLDRHPELKIRSLSGLMDQFSPAWSTAVSFAAQRRAFAANELHRLDPENLFFEYLQLRTAGALSYAAKARLLSRLLALPQFPAGRLPKDCDRKADYMWQRSSAEYQPKKKCGETFHGVDFLWMVALLTERDGERVVMIPARPDVTLPPSAINDSEPGPARAAH